MSKEQMIEQIRQRNRSATPEFLMVFDEVALRRYLDRLTTVVGHRGKASSWVRHGETPAIVTRDVLMHAV